MSKREAVLRSESILDKPQLAIDFHCALAPGNVPQVSAPGSDDRHARVLATVQHPCGGPAPPHLVEGALRQRVFLSFSPLYSVPAPASTLNRQECRR